MLLNVSEDLGDDDFAGVRQDAVLCKKLAAADGSDNLIKKEERFSDGRRLIEHLPDGGHDLNGDSSDVVFGSQLHKSPLGEARSVDPGAIEDCAHCVAIAAFKVVERHRKFAFDTWRRD